MAPSSRLQNQNLRPRNRPGQLLIACCKTLLILSGRQTFKHKQPFSRSCSTKLQPSSLQPWALQPWPLYPGPLATLPVATLHLETLAPCSPGPCKPALGGRFSTGVCILAPIPSKGGVATTPWDPYHQGGGGHSALGPWTIYKMTQILIIDHV